MIFNVKKLRIFTAVFGLLFIISQGAFAYKREMTTTKLQSLDCMSLDFLLCYAVSVEDIK